MVGPAPTRPHPTRRRLVVLYESEITNGLNVFRLGDPAVIGTIPLGHLNPQTQEFSLG
jgi:hypothetical protein